MSAFFFKRKLKKLMAKDETPLSLSIPTPAGTVSLGRPELHRYGLLHTMLSSDLSGEIGNTEGASFLLRSGLNREDLHTLWSEMKNASLDKERKTKGKISREDFFVACKLVGYKQARPEQPIALAAIVDSARLEGGGGGGGGVRLLLADFHYGVTPDTSLGGAEGGALPEFPEASIGITVGNPQTFGSGIDSHTRYQVVTNTSLAHFARKEMAVWR